MKKSRQPSLLWLKHNLREYRNGKHMMFLILREAGLVTSEMVATHSRQVTAVERAIARMQYERYPHRAKMLPPCLACGTPSATRKCERCQNRPENDAERIQRLKAENIRMRRALEQIHNYCNADPYISAMQPHEIAHLLLVEIPDIAMSALEQEITPADPNVLAEIQAEIEATDEFPF